MKILAAVTVYCDKSNLPQLLNALNSQTFPISNLLLIDNSPNQIVSNLDFENNASNITYRAKHFPENLGVSGAINYSIEFAKKHEYDAVWFFDQDSIPASDCCEHLLALLQSSESVALASCQPILAPDNWEQSGFVFSKYRFQEIKKPELRFHQEIAYYECDATITSGSMFKLKSLHTKYPADPRYFIDAVDFEMCFRLKQKHFQIFMCPSARMTHHFGATKLAEDNRTRLSNYSALRLYHICRNHTFLEIECSQSFWKIISFLWRVKFMLWQVKINLMEKTNVYQKTKACFLGTFDGLVGNFRPFRKL
jgi:rhamnosyltransferase